MPVPHSPLGRQVNLSLGRGRVQTTLTSFNYLVVDDNLERLFSSYRLEIFGQNPAAAEQTCMPTELLVATAKENA